MYTHIVEIGDEYGKSFKISVEIDYVGVRRAGTWRALDKGFLRYNSGVAQKRQVGGTFTTVNLELQDFNQQWGMRLDLWDDIWGVKDQGRGTLLQPWAIGIDPGLISWVLVK